MNFNNYFCICVKNAWFYIQLWEDRICIYIQIEEMFDQQDYYSEEEDNLQLSKHIPSAKVLIPNSGSDFNHLTGEGESLLKMMQQRGLDINDNELKKLKVNNANREKESAKSKQKAGYFDGGASASLEELLKALNKALASADPQQASAILSHILEKKTLSDTDRNKFGIMKCKILFGLGAYQDCLTKAQQLLTRKNLDHLIAASLTNYLSKSRAELDQILDGYMDLLRAKAHIESQKRIMPQLVINQKDEFADSEMDTLARQIDHTEMEYNIKMAKFKNSTNLVHPHYLQFRHRQVIQVAAGDYHALFLVSGPLGVDSSVTEVFGIGQNSVGQILGKSSINTLKQPTLLVQLSGKNIKGLAANRQSSAAWDQKGRIYEWGIKQQRNEAIDVTYQLGQKIIQFQKGYHHYAALTASGKFFTWGNISFKSSNIYKQPQPYSQPSQNIASISCGHSHITAVDIYGDIFMLGSNEYGQLGLQGELHAKTFKILNNVWIGSIRKAICIGDATFIINKQQQLFFCGKISREKQPIQRPRQGEFTGDIKFISSLSGTIGNYYMTTSTGQLYHWQVDSSVKFKIERENQKVPQRYIVANHGSVFKVRSLIVPQLTRLKLVTEKLNSYEDICFQMSLYDRNGPFGSPSFVMPPHCQIFLSTYAAKADDILKESKLFLQSYQFSGEDSRVLINEIVESRLASYRLERDKQDPSIHKLTIVSEESGKFYFYVIVEDKIVYTQQLNISVSQRQKQLSQKNKKQKQIREEQRRRKAELEHQRLLQQKLIRQREQQQRRKQTQRRAEQSYKKYMRQQEEIKLRAQQQRKARKELMTGGGFDLSKLKQRAQKINIDKIQVPEKYIDPSLKSPDPLLKTGQSFLPDINVRPNSRRKINLPGKTSFNSTNFESVSSKIQKPKIQELASTSINLFKSQSGKQKETKTLLNSSKGVETAIKPAIGGKVLLKRGLSKGKK